MVTRNAKKKLPIYPKTSRRKKPIETSPTSDALILETTGYSTKIEESLAPSEESRTPTNEVGLLVLGEDGTLYIEHLETKAAKSADSPSKLSNFSPLFLILDIFASAVWIFAVIQIFAIDLPGVILSHFAPNHLWLSNFRILIWLAILALPFLVFQRGKAIFLFCYVLFFPFVLMFWKIPKHLVTTQDWRLTFAIISASIRFYRSMKFHIAQLAIWIFGIMIGITSNNFVLLILSTAVLIGLLVTSYLSRFLSVFRAEPLDDTLKKLIERMAKKTINNKVEEPNDIHEENLNRDELENGYQGLNYPSCGIELYCSLQNNFDFIEQVACHSSASHLLR